MEKAQITVINDMNRLLSVFIIILLFLIIPVSASANDIVMDMFEETAGKGLTVQTNPAGVRVFIDGIERGVTPFTTENLMQGEYQIKLQKDGYGERVFNVTLSDTSRLVVSIRMTETRGFVVVSISGDDDKQPLNVQLAYASRLNDESLRVYTMTENKTSFTSSAELHLPAGYRTITARAFGWEDESITVLVDENITAHADIKMKRAALKMVNTSQSRRSFNPVNSGNLGAVEFRFEVSAPGEGTIKIFNSGGSVIYIKQLAQFDTWVQKETWNGRDLAGTAAPDGVYTVLIEAAGFSGETASLQFETEINNSTVIFPLSADSGLSGLVLTPMPDTLPAGNYQFNANILLGSFLYQNSAQIVSSSFGFPFKIDMRISALKKLELTTVFNFNPFPKNGTGWGISGSVKYNFIESGEIPVAFSAGLSYAWADKNGEYPVSPGKGAGLFAPLSLELQQFYIVFCPAVFWRGLIPELMLCAGVLYTGRLFNAGLSCRCEINFESKKITQTIKNLAGAEARIRLSNFIISLHGGIWTQGGFFGGFGGIGIGMIF